MNSLLRRVVEKESILRKILFFSPYVKALGVGNILPTSPAPQQSRPRSGLEVSVWLTHWPQGLPCGNEGFEGGTTENETQLSPAEAVKSSAFRDFSPAFRNGEAIK